MGAGNGGFLIVTVVIDIDLAGEGIADLNIAQGQVKINISSGCGIFRSRKYLNGNGQQQDTYSKKQQRLSPALLALCLIHLSHAPF